MNESVAVVYLKSEYESATPISTAPINSPDLRNSDDGRVLRSNGAKSRRGYVTDRKGADDENEPQ